jgi:hypothetical protein
MRFYLAGIVFLLVIGFSSCQKEIDWGTSGQVTNDSIYISQFVDLDTSFTPGLDTMDKTIFSFDTQKRIKAINIAIYTPGSPGITDIAWDERYYNGVDTLPYKIVCKFSGQTEIDTTFIFYVNGRVVKDSTVSNASSSKLVALFNWLSSTRIYERNSHYDINNNVVQEDSSYFNRVWISQNQINTADTTYGLSTIIPAFFENIQSSAIQFDNNPNPLSKLSIGYPPDFGEYVGQPGLFWGGYELSLLKNNFTIVTYSNFYPGSSTSTITYSYKYRDDGYPLIGRNNSNSIKTIYGYTSL